jgi:tetratricopeptide (TPR) repeat protein
MRLQPKNSEIWSNIAVAYENMGKSEDAMGALYQAVQLRPDNVTARMNLAAMYANANHHAKAAAQFKQVLAYEDSNEDALFNLSRCLIALGQINDAKSYLKQTIAANPNNGEAHYELGNVYWKKDRDIDKGIAEYKLAIAVQPQSAHLYENLALAYEEKKMKTEAMDTWKTALSHTDDVLAKDKIKDRIDRLETGSTAPAAGAPKSSGGSSNTVTKEQINDLKNELRGTEKSQQRINTAPVNVMDDLNDMNEEDEKPLDLRDEAKKRANK